jgi:prepilin-type N-terminal cleavage/methylation domain-containing protein
MRDAGFSLVEMMIATLLLATSLAALAELFAVAGRNNVVARHSTESAVLAAQKTEQLRGDASQLTIGSAADVPDNTAYVRHWSVDALPDNHVVIVEVVVTPPDNRGAARVITLMRRAP